ncbi:phosphoserine phosphatase [Vibrio sp.]|nr:phosphoserine phosphatase [Vibrio sp.]
MSQSLPIKRHTSLLTRFPEIKDASFLDKQKSNWIVFSSYLTPKLFEAMDFYLGQVTPVIDCWKVGNYEVVLMLGDITSGHQEFLSSMNIDYAELIDIPELTNPGVAVFDMDSTLIDMECIDEIAKLAGVGHEVSKVTESAMQGELDFEESLRLRVSKLEGAPEAILEQVKQTLPLMPDCIELITTLKSFGWKTAIASGGFTYFSEHLKELCGFDYAQSNQLEIVDGRLTGKVIGEVVSASTKADVLQSLAAKYEIEMNNTIAVGDGANDLVMMRSAGLGVAYHAKPKVEQEAQAAVKFVGLGGVLCILSAGLVKYKRLSWLDSVPAVSAE